MYISVLFIQACWAYANIRAIFTPWIGYLGYAVFVVLCPQWNWRWGWNYSIDYQKFLAIATLIGALMVGALGNRIHGVGWKSITAITGFILLAMVSSFQTLNPSLTTDYFDKLWKIVLMAVMGILLIDEPKKLVWIVAAIVLSQGWNAYNVNELYYEYGVRVDSFTWNYNDNNTYAISTVPVMALAFGVMLVYKHFWLRILTGLIFVLQMHQIMILQSRGTMLGGLVLAVFGFIFMPKSKYAFQVFGVGLVCGMILAGPSVVEEFTSAFKPTEELDSSASGRFDLWRAGFQITMDNPLLGVGPYCGQMLVPRYLGLPMGTKGLHNLFFEISTGCGFPAVFLYVGYFLLPWLAHLGLWLRGQISDDEHILRAVNLATLCGIPGYWASSMFSSGALLESSYILVVCSCAACTIIQKRDEGAYDVDQEDPGEEFDWDNSLDQFDDEPVVSGR